MQGSRQITFSLAKLIKDHRFKLLCCYLLKADRVYFMYRIHFQFKTGQRRTEGTNMNFVADLFTCFMTVPAHR